MRKGDFMILSDKEYNMLILEIGLKIGYYRRKSGMTQHELAEAAEISLSHLSELESPNMAYCPSIKILIKLSKALGVKLHKFLEIDD